MQERLIELVVNENIPHRVRADRSLETAQKWKNKIYDFCVDIAFDLFERPALFDYGPPIQYDEYIFKLAKHNIPFYTFIIQDNYTIITSQSDTVYIGDHIVEGIKL